MALVPWRASTRPEIAVVVCVAANDREWARIATADLLPRHLRAEIDQFIACRPALDEAGPTIAWRSRDETLTAIDDPAARWAATVNGRG
ncbi:MAG: hypothetical protein ACRDPM_17175 [Solirubrobacteraceae bacterium]